MPQLKVDNELPLYVTEILTTVVIIYMLISNSISSGEAGEGEGEMEEEKAVVEGKKEELLKKKTTKFG